MKEDSFNCNEKLEKYSELDQFGVDGYRKLSLIIIKPTSFSEYLKKSVLFSFFYFSVAEFKQVYRRMCTTRLI